MFSRATYTVTGNFTQTVESIPKNIEGENLNNPLEAEGFPGELVRNTTLGVQTGPKILSKTFQRLFPFRRHLQLNRWFPIFFVDAFTDISLFCSTHD